MGKKQKAKQAKAKAPKRIAGVKIPKRLRNSRLGEFLASPLGKEILGGAAVAAGGALAAKESKRHSAVRRAGSGLQHAGEDAAHSVATGASHFTFALGEAARTFAEALQRGPREGYAFRDGGRTWSGDHDLERVEPMDEQKRAAPVPQPEAPTGL